MTVEFLNALENAINNQKRPPKHARDDANKIYLSLHQLLLQEAEWRSWQDHNTLNKAPEYGLAPLVYDPDSALPPVESPVKRLIPQGIIDEWRENPALIPALIEKNHGKAVLRHSLVVIINALLYTT